MPIEAAEIEQVRQALVRYAEARLNAERIKAGDRHPA